MFSLKKVLMSLILTVVSLNCSADDFNKQIIGSWVMDSEKFDNVATYLKDGTFIGSDIFIREGKLVVDRQAKGTWKIVDGVIITDSIITVKSKNTNWRPEQFKQTKEFKIVLLKEDKLIKSSGKSEYKTSWVKQKNLYLQSLKNLNQNIFGVNYGSKPTDDMKRSGSNEHGEWYNKKPASLIVDGVNVDKVYYNFNKNGFNGVSMAVKGQHINALTGVIASIYGLADKSDTAPFRVAHLWNEKNFNISMDANYTRGQATFSITHKNNK